MADQTRQNTDIADEMRSLFRFMYNPQDAYNAFTGYSKNQQKKLLDDKLDRKYKFGVAYLRTAYCLVDLFETGGFSLYVRDEQRVKTLKRIKEGYYRDGEIIDVTELEFKRPECYSRKSKINKIFQR